MLAITTITSLDEIEKQLIIFLQEEKRQLQTRRAGLVSGIMNSDGPEYKKRNCERLKQYAQRFRKTYHFPIISSPDIFTDELYEKLKKTDTTYEDLDHFWIQLLESGVITDVFMTPRWEQSKGATNEKKKAQTQNLVIHYLT